MAARDMPATTKCARRAEPNDDITSQAAARCRRSPSNLLSPTRALAAQPSTFDHATRATTTSVASFSIHQSTMSFSLFGGRPQPSSEQKIAAAETEVEMVSDMFNRYGP